MSVLIDYTKKVNKALANIKDVESFQGSDVMVKYVMDKAKWVFDKKLDQISVQTLVRVGGRLTGAYAYIGQKSSEARAKRDVAESKLDEMLNEMTVNNYASSDDKITLARAQAKSDVSQLKDFVIIANNSKNNWENIANACEKMIGFIQSAIKVKENEMFRSRDMQDTN